MSGLRLEHGALDSFDMFQHRHDSIMPVLSANVNH